MELRRPDEHYTYADYAQWKGGWELWFGQPVAMSPSPAERHGLLAAKLVYHLIDSLQQQNACQCRVSSEIDWRLEDDLVVRPDVNVVCGGQPSDGPICETPTLIAEVLSPSTQHRDQTSKRDLYASRGVKHYLIVEPTSGRIKALVLEGTQYNEAPEPLDLELHPGCRVTLPAALKV